MSGCSKLIGCLFTSSGAVTESVAVPDAFDSQGTMGCEVSFLLRDFLIAAGRIW